MNYFWMIGLLVFAGITFWQIYFVLVSGKKASKAVRKGRYKAPKQQPLWMRLLAYSFSVVILIVVCTLIIRDLYSKDILTNSRLPLSKFSRLTESKAQLVVKGTVAQVSVNMASCQTRGYEVIDLPGTESKAVFAYVGTHSIVAQNSRAEQCNFDFGVSKGKEIPNNVLEWHCDFDNSSLNAITGHSGAKFIFDKGVLQNDQMYMGTYCLRN